MSYIDINLDTEQGGKLTKAHIALTCFLAVNPKQSTGKASFSLTAVVLAAQVPTLLPSI